MVAVFLLRRQQSGLSSAHSATRRKQKQNISANKRTDGQKKRGDKHVDGAPTCKQRRIMLRIGNLSKSPSPTLQACTFTRPLE